LIGSITRCDWLITKLPDGRYSMLLNRKLLGQSSYRVLQYAEYGNVGGAS